MGATRRMRRVAAEGPRGPRPAAGSRPFPGEGVIRIVYFAILITHVLLAAAILPLALITTARGLWAQYDRHVRIARWTLPIWIYVSVTGVVIYLMLYRIYGYS